VQPLLLEPVVLVAGPVEARLLLRLLEEWAVRSPPMSVKYSS
jgi:hypothetical protein